MLKMRRALLLILILLLTCFTSQAQNDLPISMLSRSRRFANQQSSSLSNQFKFFAVFLFFLGVLILSSLLIFFICKCRKQKENNRPSIEARYTVLNTRPISSYLSEQSARSSTEQDETELEKLPRQDLLDRLMRNQINYEDYKRNFEINAENLKINSKKLLGKGQFGFVELGFLTKNHQTLTVAVKKLKRHVDPSEQDLFMAELTVMCAIKKHPCILALVGGVTTSNPCRIVLEYVEGGSLLDHLRNSKSKFEDLLIWKDVNGEKQKIDEFRNKNIGVRSYLNGVSTFDLISFAYQIAKGMEYLASIPCVHRDVALRNILIASDGTIRIADFGLSRKCQDKSYYRPPTKDQDETSRPWLWMSPEAFAENKFTEKSDVWSFAVCLHELFTFGETPIKDADRQEWQPFWKTEGLLEEPKFCPRKIYSDMIRCWNEIPDHRPNFSECLNDFRNHLKNCSSKGYKNVKSKLEKVTQQHKALETWVQSGI